MEYHENVSINQIMPLVPSSKYSGSPILFNGHLQTIIPALFRPNISLPFERERINTPDGDFLDLDWLRNNHSKLIILSHGLEGDSQRPYMKGMAKHFFQNGFDVLCWNFRGCSGSMNKRPVFYHSGATHDLQTVISHAAAGYDQVNLIGFSLGGNLTLKYLGELSDPLPIHRAVAISVPLHLESSCHKISTGENIIYSNRFLKTLKQKVRQKAKLFPEQLNEAALASVKTLQDFDDVFTGPLHGFTGAKDYYEQCSSIHFLSKIKTPTLVINALNDPFLSDHCFPKALASQLDNVFMEFPDTGGHVGFRPLKRNQIYWSEKRALEFITMDDYFTPN